MNVTAHGSWRDKVISSSQPHNSRYLSPDRHRIRRKQLAQQLAVQKKSKKLAAISRA